MSKKLSILATALTLGRFTVAELASRSGATPATVHTVLGRAPSDWFLKSQQASGNRGGQPVGYELTETGRAAIEGELHKVTPATLTRLAPEQPPLDEPLGLVAAREILAELPLAKPEVSAGLREDALGNLQWAQAEVQGGAFAAYRERLLEDISRLRAQLGANGDIPAFKNAVETFTSAAESVTAPETFAVVARRQMAYWREKFAEYWSGPTAESARKFHVVISYLDDDNRSRELAVFARGALASAQRERMMKYDLVVQPLNLKHFKDELEEAWTRIGAEAVEMILCINSEASSHAVYRALQTAKGVKSLKGAVVLDESYSKEVQSFAEHYDICYQPHASQTDELEWVERAMPESSFRLLM